MEAGEAAATSLNELSQTDGDEAVADTDPHGGLTAAERLSKGVLASKRPANGVPASKRPPSKGVSASKRPANGKPAPAPGWLRYPRGSTV